MSILSGSSPASAISLSFACTDTRYIVTSSTKLHPSPLQSKDKVTVSPPPITKFLASDALVFFMT
jgi:hypothetical protein